MASSEGQKVKTDPETFNNPKNENPGIVTSDSLAAESIQEGGSFAANADSRGPMAQPSYSTTANTTDTGNAIRLEPAPDAEARQVSEEWNEAAVLNSGLASNTKDEGIGPTWNTPSGGTGVVDQDERERTYGTGNAAPAPGYVAHPAPTVGDNFLPKGNNLTEGGFDPDAPNASFNTDIGGKNDPGRAALNRFEEKNTPFAGGAGPREDQISGGKQFDVLDETSS